ncbi:Cro/CI family transcriptional regulator [Aeromonas piscicola]|uniref:Cro/CI family transcriptional regulator n=1 Tax=Aeromonas piscicola TaxID=600645 RepID=A0ABT7QFZ3_9GAMM|nr:Cro/CI family transcriptional regulator [Aeromonas piscicola]MDM5132882.1 Cro/CI family transcriptional regulator [Aeromonas piscicola]
MTKKDVLAHFGGPSATAKRLGITAQAVSRWPDVIPPGRAYQIEVLTGGKLKADQSQAAQGRA